MKPNRAAHIAALIERIGRLLATEAHAEGLLPVHWETLRYLERANRFSRTAAALTAWLGITKGTVSQTLNSLEKKGLIRKRTDQHDRRSKLLSLTANGRTLLRRDPLDQTVAAIQMLAEPAQLGLVQGLEALLRTRLAAQDRLPFGQCRDCRYFANAHPNGGPHYCQLLEEKLAESESVAICFEQVPAEN